MMPVWLSKMYTSMALSAILWHGASAFQPHLPYGLLTPRRVPQAGGKSPYHNLADSFAIRTQPYPGERSLPPLPRQGRTSRSASALSGLIPAATSVLSPIVASPWYVWSMLLVASTIGVWAERTRIGSALSSPLITMAAALAACNLGLLPLNSPCYVTVNKYLVPLAIPLLLLDADLRRVIKGTGRMLSAFVIGALGTVVGTIVACLLVPLKIGPDGWKIATALTSRHIGGAVNYVAVTETLNTSAELVAAGIAADNLVVSLYFALLFALAGEMAGGPEAEDSAPSRPSSPNFGAWPPGVDNDSPALRYLKALTISCLLCLGGTVVSQTVLKGAISSLPIISLLAVIGATIFSKTFAQVTEPGGHIAVILMNLFFAVTGASGRIDRVLATAPRLFLFSTTQLLVHLAFMLTVGRGIFRLPMKELLVASNANVGGPTTAAAMAGTKKWKSLVLPGILTGILGYATATFISLALGRGLLVKMAP